MEKYKRLSRDIKEKIIRSLQETGVFINIPKLFFIVDTRVNGWRETLIKKGEEDEQKDFEKDFDNIHFIYMEAWCSNIENEDKPIVLCCLYNAWDEAVFDTYDELFEFLLEK